MKAKKRTATDHVFTALAKLHLLCTSSPHTIGPLAPICKGTGVGQALPGPTPPSPRQRCRCRGYDRSSRPGCARPAHTQPVPTYRLSPCGASAHLVVSHQERAAGALTNQSITPQSRGYQPYPCGTGLIADTNKQSKDIRRRTARQGPAPGACIHYALQLACEKAICGTKCPPPIPLG